MTQEEYNKAYAGEIDTVTDVIRRSCKLTDDDRMNLTTATSAMQLCIEAMGPAVVRGDGAVMMMVATGGCSIGTAVGGIDELRGALVAIGREQADNKEAFGAMLIAAALEISPELKTELLEAIHRT